MGQLVDEEDGGATGDRAVEVELLESGAAVLRSAAGQDLEPLEQSLGLSPPVRLHETDDDIHTVRALLARGLHRWRSP